MFRDVLQCSGMFHVPDFIDRPSRDQKSFKLSPVICIALDFLILLSVSLRRFAISFKTE